MSANRQACVSPSRGLHWNAQLVLTTIAVSNPVQAPVIRLVAQNEPSRVPETKPGAGPVRRGYLVLGNERD